MKGVSRETTNRVTVENEGRTGLSYENGWTREASVVSSLLCRYHHMPLSSERSEVDTRGRVSDGRNGKRAASPHHPSSLPLLGSLPFTLCLTPPHAPFTPLRSCPSSTPLHSVPSRRGEVTEERRNRAPKGRDEEWKDDTTGGTHHTRLSYRHHHVFPLSLRSAGCDMMTVRERRGNTQPKDPAVRIAYEPWKRVRPQVDEVTKESDESKVFRSWPVSMSPPVPSSVSPLV